MAELTPPHLKSNVTGNETFWRNSPSSAGLRYLSKSPMSVCCRVYPFPSCILAWTKICNSTLRHNEQYQAVDGQQPSRACKARRATVIRLHLHALIATRLMKNNSLGIELTKVMVLQYSNQETSVTIGESVRDEDGEYCAMYYNSTHV
jgi:hypothetical protein